MLVFPYISQYFAAVAAECKPGNKFLGLPTWYQYLDVQYDAKFGCHIDKFNFPGDLGLIALAIANLLLRLGGLVAFGFVVWGGIQYVVSQGEPDKTKRAQETILNAVIGMAIAMFATAFVTFIGSRLGA